MKLKSDPRDRSQTARQAEELAPEDPTLQIRSGIEEARNQVLAFIAWRSQFLEQEGRSSEAETQRQILHLLAPDYVAPAAEAPAAPTPAPAPSLPKPSLPKPLLDDKRRHHLVYLGASIAVAIVALVVFFVLRSRPSILPPAGTPIAITVVPDDAQIEIDGGPYNNQPLAPGAHSLRISRAGYSVFEKQIDLPVSEPLRVLLRPLGTLIRLDAQPAPAEWSLDDSPPTTFSDSQTPFPALTAGKHTVQIFAQAGGQGPSSFEIEAGNTQPPKVTAMKMAPNSIGVALSQFGSEKPTIFSSSTLSVLDYKGTEVGQTGPAPVTLPSPEAGDWLIRGATNELRVQTGRSDAPVLDLYLRTDAPTGGIVLRVDQDARLRLNGRLQPRLTLRAGAVTPLRGLSPGSYRISVEKDGYRAEPAVAQIRVTARQDIPLQFHLIHLATVDIRNARPGARLFLNGADLGTVGENGSLTANVDPGPCRLELRLAKYQHRPVERQCGPGESVVLSGLESAMTMTVGQIHIPSMTPSEAKVVVLRPGESTPLSIGYTELPVGKYQLRASAPGYADKSIPNLEITPGRINELGPVELKPLK